MKYARAKSRGDEEEATRHVRGLEIEGQHGKQERAGQGNARWKKVRECAGSDRLDSLFPQISEQKNSPRTVVVE